MPTVRDIFTKLCGEMPLSGCESWDNSGLLVGSADNEVKKVLVSLDVTLPVVSEAERGRYELVVSHHPVIFRPVPSVTDETPTGLILQKLIKNDISVISMHTNADVACGGVNDLLAEALGLKDVGSLRGGEAGELGRFGELCEQMTLHGFLEHVRASLSPFAGARFVDAGRPVKRVAVGGGACGELLYNAKKTGCDTFLTSDIKYSSDAGGGGARAQSDRRRAF